LPADETTGAARSRSSAGVGARTASRRNDIGADRGREPVPSAIDQMDRDERTLLHQVFPLGYMRTDGVPGADSDG